MPDDYDVEDDDILSDLFMDEPENDDNPGFDPAEVKSLKDQIAQLQKQNNGLIQTVKADRRKKQEATGRLDALTAQVNSILSARQQAEQQLAMASSDDDRIEIDITDDGDAFIPKNKLNDIVSPLQQRIDQLEEQLQLTTSQNSAAQEAEQLMQSLIGEDERYSAVYPKYRSARKWANDKVIEFQRDNNIRGTLSSGQALTHVFDDDAMSEFQQRFPGLDLPTVITAEDSTWHFKQMLSKAAENAIPKVEPDARFRQVINKPSGLGKSANAKGGELSLSERVGQLSATDILSLTDDQIEALQKFQQMDEQKEGIRF
jgi:hypothetical protein